MSSEFERLRESCLKRGDLWQDPDFPAIQTSVFYHQKPPFNFVWKRPKDLVIEPQFISESPTFDVIPGKLGDRWLVQCLGCLYSSKGLFYRVVPADQGFHTQDDYAGIFRFRIWWCGSWREVLVDDRLPTVNNRLVFISSNRSAEFWPALLEKAYAKLHGSYEALKYGSVLDGLADLTGGVAESILLKNDPTGSGRLLIELLDMTSVITANVQVENNKKGEEKSKNGHQEKMANGITIGTNYRVYAVQKIQTMSGEIVQLVHLRSGDSSSYMGSWAPGSSDWEEVDIDEKERVGARRSPSPGMEGEFWMTYMDFIRTFTHLEVVHLDSETARDEPSMQGKNRWNMRFYSGAWQKGVTAGGCRNNSDTFHINPQLQLHVSQHDNVILSLSQHCVSEPQVIGFTGYPLPPESDSISRSYFRNNRSLLNSQYTNSRHVTHRSVLEAASYMILPTTFEPGQEATFTFRVLSHGQAKLRSVDVTPAIIKSAIIKAPATLTDTKGFEQYDALFMQLSDDRKTVNAFELQELLETCLPNDYIKSCASIEVCRQVVVAMDKERNSLGRLGYSEFKDLIVSLKLWQGVFRTHTKEKTGVLRAERLRDALLEVGFRLSGEILSIIILRYMRKDGTLRFGDFVAIILNLTVAFAMFERKDSTRNGVVKINMSEWVRCALSC